MIITGSYTGWPRKNATPTIHDFKKTRDRINKLCPLLRIQFFFQENDTKIIYFHEGFWFYGCFTEAMSFSKFATFVSKVTIDVRKLFIVWLPRVKCLLLLWKTKTAWIKRSIHYVILPCYNLGKALKEIPPYLNCDFWYKRNKFWKWQCFRKMALQSNCLHQNYWSWCHFAGKRIFYTFMHSLLWSIPWFL